MKTFTLILISFMLFSCDQQEQKLNTGIVDTAKLASKAGDSSAKIAKADTMTSAWGYDTVKDAMTSASILYANTTCTNSFEFAPPYDGGNSAELTIRKKRGETDVYLTIEKGQFMAGVEGTDIKARFDEHKYNTYFCNGAADDDPKVLFISEASEFIAHLKNSKTLIIEANIYDNGEQQFVFNTAGLKWSQPHHHNKNMTIILGKSIGWKQTKTKNGKDTLEYGYIN